MFVLLEVQSDPGIAYSRLYGCATDRAQLDAIIDAGLITSSRGDGVNLTVAGDDLLLLMRNVAARTDDTRYKDVRERIRKRYEGRLQRQYEKYHSEGGAIASKRGEGSNTK